MAANGGHIVLTKHWSEYLLQGMGYVKRKPTTKAKVSVEDLEVCKKQFLKDIIAVVNLENIPNELILTGIKLLSIMCLSRTGQWLKKRDNHFVNVSFRDNLIISIISMIWYIRNNRKLKHFLALPW